MKLLTAIRIIEQGRPSFPQDAARWDKAIDTLYRVLNDIRLDDIRKRTKQQTKGKDIKK